MEKYFQLRVLRNLSRHTSAYSEMMKLFSCAGHHAGLGDSHDEDANVVVVFPLLMFAL